MADGRMLKKKISLNEALANLDNDTHRLLFTWAIPHLDIEGRISGSPRVFKATVAPLLDHITAKKVDEFFDDAIKNGLIIRYVVDEKPFIEYPTFKDNQKLNPAREAPSKIPDPSGNKSVITKVLGHYGYYGANWKEAQNQVRERDKVCQLCNKEENLIKRMGKVVKRALEVHHIVSFKLLNDIQEANKKSNLISLCHACHLRVRANPDLIKDHPIVQQRLVEYSLSTPTEVKLREEKLIEEKLTPLTPLAGGNGFDQDFSLWWKEYPPRRKQDKPGCFKKWRHLKKAGVLPDIETMLAILRMQKQSSDWQKEAGEFIPGPGPYLNKHKFLDESILQPQRNEPKGFAALREYIWRRDSHGQEDV